VIRRRNGAAALDRLFQRHSVFFVLPFLDRPTVQASIGASAGGEVPSVLEPSAWALLLGGLALVGARARRR
jgi:hypothetical protein